MSTHAAMTSAASPEVGRTSRHTLGTGTDKRLHPPAGGGVCSQAGDGIVAGIGSKQEPPIGREDDATRALEIVRPVDQVDWAETPGTGAVREDTFRFGKGAARRPR
jgi:hypothetical protein